MQSALYALREKYAEMRAMRVADDGDPARMRALAERFPGALREIDELPMETIEARIDAIDRALAGDAEAPSWTRYLAEYHAWMRAALRVRRAAGKTRDREQARSAIRGQDDPSEAELESALDDLLRPPAGRLSRWVLARIALREGKTAQEIEDDAFPPSPRRSPRRNA
jgi:hypothetical protein